MPVPDTSARYCSVPETIQLPDREPLSNPSLKGIVATFTALNITSRSWAMLSVRFEMTREPVWTPAARFVDSAVTQTVIDVEAPAARLPLDGDADIQDASTSADQLTAALSMFVTK